MAVNFAELRKTRGNFEDLVKEVEKIAKPAEFAKDERLWQPTVDKAGNGYSVIRFLAPPPGEQLPWVRYWNHGFQGPTGKWYIENSLTTFGEDDPVSALNSELWNTGLESNKDIARKQKRRLVYVSNILVIKDPANPDSEGKVFLYKYGKKIFDKIKDIMQPEFEDEDKINPFDFWKGANLKLKIRKYEGYRNYDKSEFDNPSPISDDDAEIEKIWKQEHSLSEFLDRKNFKTYEELKKRLNFVLNTSASPSAMKAAEDMEVEEYADPSMKVASARAIPTSAADEDDDDNALSYFSNLVNDE